MKRLISADPNLSFPQRKGLLQEIIPARLAKDQDVAMWIESNWTEVEAAVRSVRDSYCSESILSWA